MSEARLAPGVEVSALLLRVAAEGGFGAVLAKGDADRGTILLVLLQRGDRPTRLLERLPDREGRYSWQRRDFSDSAELDQHLARIRRNDPDIWILELDVPSTERFTAEMI